VLSLYPLGQPEKAIGHEPQIDLCVANEQPHGLCQLQELIRVVATRERCNGDGKEKSGEFWK
jgi:hypothetical protein